MTSAAVSRWARRFVTTSAGFLLAWQVLALAGVSRRAHVTVGLLGFVFHTLFGKAYALVPSYFDRTLAEPRGPAVQLPLTAGGTVLLVAATATDAPPVVGATGASLWLAGVGVFALVMGSTLRGNLTGSATATSDANAERRGVDRVANAFVPVAFGYLLAGSYAVAAPHAGLPTLLDGNPPRASHLLAAGGAALLLFAVGFRLLPRFLVARPPRSLVALVLPAGAVGPAMLALGLPAGGLLQAGAALEAVAVLGFGLAVASLYRASDKRRVGLYGVLLGMVGGAAGALLGLQFVLAGRAPDLVLAHLRLNLLGFLGLTIAGVTFQFYPPAAGRLPGSSDRTALATLACLAGGLALEVAGLVGGGGPLVWVGRGFGVVGAVGYAYLVVAALLSLRRRGN